MNLAYSSFCSGVKVALVFLVIIILSDGLF
ncbi:MAG: hypothetical protein ACI9VT_001806 [Psychroserpens sp.]